MLERRQILIEGMIDDACASMTIAKLLFLNQKNSKAPISLFINSPGGQVTAILAIRDTIGFLVSPVYTYGQMQVNGAALWLLAAGEPGHRCIQHGSHLSIEPTRFGHLEGEVLEYAVKLNDMLARLLAKCTSLDEEAVKSALVLGRSFTVEEAISASMADGVFDGTL